MMSESKTWQNISPADLDQTLPFVSSSDVVECVRRADTVFSTWSSQSLGDRITALKRSQTAIQAQSEELARLIAKETGKPLAEARGELGAVIAKFDLSFADAEDYIADCEVIDGPHPALIRHKPRGPAAVIAPFNFPIHLGHGAAVAYLLAGNPVLYKPSPLAAATGAAYGDLMSSTLPPGVFQIVQGWGETGHSLCVHPSVRSVCFTGSIPVGAALAKELAADYSKSLALELGGKCAALVCEDADIESAATDIATAGCLTAGQRCNATSLVFIHRSVVDSFLNALMNSLSIYQPGDPLTDSTKLGPVISSKAVERYRTLTSLEVGKWLLPGKISETVQGKRGHYVRPALVYCEDFARLAASPLYLEESFCPILTIIPFVDDKEAIRLHNTSAFGLTSSIFTSDRARFDAIGRTMHVGNLYWNLPTTFSPSTLPFGGLGISGNGKPGARGFSRFAADEQSVQWKRS